MVEKQKKYLIKEKVRVVVKVSRAIMRRAAIGRVMARRGRERMTDSEGSEEAKGEVEGTIRTRTALTKGRDKARGDEGKLRVRRSDSHPSVLTSGLSGRSFDPMSEPAEKIRKALQINAPAVIEKLTGFIKQKVEAARARGVVLGLSGGLDSSIVAFLCARAVGGGRVLCVCMPEAGVTDPQDLNDAREMADSLGASFKLVDITPGLLEMQANLPGFEIEALLPGANLKARLRMAILYYYANLHNRLVVGCSNRSELRAGYFTKYGDGAADLLPLGCLYKTQVKQLAAHLGVQKRITEKVPSAGLWRGQTDEGELGLPYEKLDAIYVGLDLGLEPKAVAEASGISAEKVKDFIERERLMAHKLKFPEVPEL